METKNYEELIRKTNKYFFTKIVFNIALMVLGAIGIIYFLHVMQHQAATAKQRANSESSLNEVITTLHNNQKDVQYLTNIYHNSNQQTLDDLKKLLIAERFDLKQKEGVDKRTEMLSDVLEKAGLEYLFIIDKQGNVVLSPVDYPYFNNNVVSAKVITRKSLARLVKGTKDRNGALSPVLDTDTYKEYYFYSTPFRDGKNTYYLVIGQDTSMLKAQSESLNDILEVLEGASVTNGGFMFAVDKTTDSFIYYKNGEDVLTGKNILESGLSEECLEDGYAGSQKIKGVKYYCVSRRFNDKTIICAVADEAAVLGSEKYALFWSVLGYIFVMILCVSYAIIIRNDLIRQEEETRRIRLTKKTNLILDLTILQKVMPLMLTGVIIVFFVSFYTQTLLEISSSIAKSETALEEVSDRYKKSVKNREIITQYYTNHYLSKAKLLAYLIEEDPSCLNEDTDNVYSEYDKNGKKIYLSDNEDNILKSVSRSKSIQELCDTNDIKELYVFNDLGNTIATNTEYWYFSLSTNPEDQSFAFRDVLDGKKDNFIQTTKENDNGEVCQYIGTRFNYYITKDAEGKTRYVSRYEYKKYVNAEDKSAYPYPITKHSSMLQIALNQDITEAMLESTDVSTIFSTDLLKDGFIVLINDDENHTIAYSPFEQSIGKTSKEIGFTPSRFGDMYYGFLRINGVTYFNNMKYDQNYYIVTAIPKKAMYRARFPIALFTSLISMFVIIILMMTVALTNVAEEKLFAEIAKIEDEKLLKQSIVKAIMPQGDRPVVRHAPSWDSRLIPWKEKAPEQKLVFMMGWCFVVTMIILIWSLAYASNMFTGESIILYIISGNWDRGINIFAFTACAIVFIMAILCIKLIRIPVRLVTSFLGSRSETVAHLILSVSKYGGALACLFYCLFLLGLDSSSLLASAGILSLVVGLGAQSLIKDIIAGVFVVFEGEFRVGDIVTINDFRGRVVEIGLRTTKILNIEGNTKIYNNSDISAVLNMTKSASLAYIDVSVEYGQNIDYVENILRRELPKIRKFYPEILDGPYYRGVYELADSSVKLRIAAYCYENDILNVKFILNKAILDIFYENNINIPFNCVTIFDGDKAHMKKEEEEKKEDE